MPDMEFEEKPRTRIRRAPLKIEEDEPFETAMDDLDEEAEEEQAEDEDEDDFDEDVAAQAQAEEDASPRSFVSSLSLDREQEVLNKPKLTLAQERRSARQTKASPARNNVAERVSEDFVDILEDLEFGVQAHKVSVERLEPQYDPHNPHRRIAGHCGTFTRRIDKDDIQKQFGGGRYAVVVRGPNESTGRGSQIKARRVVEIAGAPIPLPDPRAEAERRKKEEQKQNNLVEKLLAREDARAAKAEEQALALQQKLQESQMNMVELFAKVNENKTDPSVAMSTALTPVLETMREDARRRDEQAKAERERLEVQRREDREEQRRRDEEERRRHEKELQQQQQQFTMQMEQMRQQMELQKEQVKAEAHQQQANMQMMLQFMTKTDADKESRNREQAQMQIQMFQQMSDLQRSSLESQMGIVMEQLKDAKNKDDFTSSIEKFMALKELINPSESDDRETWEKVLDRVGETVPGVVAGLGAVRGQVGAAPQQQQQQYQQPGGPRPALMSPGTVAVVDDIDGATGQPYTAQPEAHLQEQVTATVEPVHAQGAQQEEPVEETINPLTEFPEAYQSEGLQEALTELVYRLDLAVSRDLSADEVYAKCGEPLPAASKAFLKALPTETLLSFIEDNVPATWPIRSLQGEQVVRAAHERLKTSA